MTYFLQTYSNEVSFCEGLGCDTRGNCKRYEMHSKRKKDGVYMYCHYEMVMKGDKVVCGNFLKK